MHPVLLVAACFLPPLAWAVRSLRTGLLPLRSVLGSVPLSLAAVLAASLSQILLDPVSLVLSGAPGILFSGFIVAALVEELARLAAVALLSGSRPAPSRSLFAGALLVGLFFSAFENLAYALPDPSILWLRTLTSLPVHAAASLLGAAFLSGAGCALRAGPGPLPLLIAVVLHGTFSSGMDAGGAGISVALLAALVLGILARDAWTRAPQEEA